MSSISQKNQNEPNFGENQGVWTYKNFDGDFLGYAVRKKRKDGKKMFQPWTFQNGEWIKKWWPDVPVKPIYNAHLLKLYPNASVLICEGEKAADAAQHLFPDLVCLTWMGGAQSSKKIDIEHLHNRKICLWPDNDETGIQAMKNVYERLKTVADCIGIVDVESLNLEKKWDLADFDENHSEIDLELIRKLISDVFESPPSWDFDVFTYPELNGSKKNPKPIDVTENLNHLLNFFNIKVRYNMMARQREVVVNKKSFYIEEEENAALNYITDLAVRYDFPIRRIDKHLDAIAWENPYHPIRDWILSRPLKNRGIFDQFKKCLKTTNDDLSFILLKKWMVSAVAAAFSDGEFTPQGVLVIQGEQYTHKSTFIMSLVPHNLNAIKGGLILDPSKKDDIFIASEYWISELAELEGTFRKSDIARLKAHINTSFDSHRRPYAVRNSKLIRRSVYAATVNEARFLVDTTGNRRWWTISITEPIKTRHGLDMQQVWREIYELWKEGEDPNLTKDELFLLNNFNQDFECLDPLQEKLISHFHWDRKYNTWMCATEILEAMGYNKITHSELKRMGDVLKKMNLKKGTGKKRRSYLMPPLKHLLTYEKEL